MKINILEMIISCTTFSVFLNWPGLHTSTCRDAAQCQGEINVKCIHFDDFLGAISQPEPVACSEPHWPGDGVTVNIII